jgi:hypothetical protein
VDSKQAIQDMRQYIKPLSDIQKQTLKLRIRTWEDEQAPVTTPAAVAVAEQPLVRRIQVAAPVDSQEPELVDIFCHFCGRLNRAGESMCHACGRLLDLSQQIDQSTRILRQTSQLNYSDEFFGEDFILQLTIRGTQGFGDYSYEIRPQEVNREISIGRTAYGSVTSPDIDLSDHDAESQGVSRHHLNLFFDPNDHVIGVIDQGSANGSFVNGQRLHRSEVRILRNGDELRLGRMPIYVKFFTYDFSS